MFGETEDTIEDLNDAIEEEFTEPKTYVTKHDGSKVTKRKADEDVYYTIESEDEWEEKGMELKDECIDVMGEFFVEEYNNRLDELVNVVDCSAIDSDEERIDFILREYVYGEIGASEKNYDVNLNDVCWDVYRDFQFSENDEMSLDVSNYTGGFIGELLDFVGCENDSVVFTSGVFRLRFSSSRKGFFDCQNGWKAKRYDYKYFNENPIFVFTNVSELSE